MNEYPRMLYRDAVDTSMTVTDAEAEEAARGDGWMSLLELKAALAAPPRRRGRQSKEPADADAGEGPPDQ